MERNLRQPGFWMAALLVGLVLFIQLVLGIPVAILDLVIKHGLHRPSPHLDRQPLVLGAINILAFGAAIALGLYLNRMSFRRAFSIGRITPLQVVGVAVTVLGLDLLLSELDNVFRALVPVPLWLSNLMKDIFASQDKPFSRIFLLVMVAPLTEEMLFRGLILRGLLSRYRPAAAVALTALLFALIHCNPWQFFSPLLLGIFFGWFYLRTGSLGLCIMAHAFSNGMGLIATFLPMDIPGFSSPPDFTKATSQPWWLNLSGLVLLLFGSWIFRKAAPSTGGLLTQLPPVIPQTTPEEAREPDKTA